MRGADFRKTDRARSLRLGSTDAGRCLWRRLRARGLRGHKFVRQEAIGPYFVDFVCGEYRLIIELDGGQHAKSKRDAVRDACIVSAAHSVLEVWHEPA